LDRRAIVVKFVTQCPDRPRIVLFTIYGGFLIKGWEMVDTDVTSTSWVVTGVRCEPFDAIVREYQGRIVRYINRLVNDPELAMDLTQDTFVNAFRGIHSLKSELALGAWLYRIATHLAVRARTRNGRLHMHRLTDFENTTHAATAAPDDQIMERELVQQALMRLPRERAACLLLNVKEGFSYAEVAEIVGTTPEGARKRIARAKEQFRTLYDGARTEARLGELH
jgi:RNA polymerase sigma-70 factor (ECF subfamily)